MEGNGELSTEDLAQPARGQQQGQPPGAGEAPPPVMNEPAGTERSDVGDSAMQRGDRVAGDEPAAGSAHPSGASGVGSTRGADDAGGDVGLLDPSDEQTFRQRWSDVQARFVDDPQEAVRTADGLVAELMQSLAQGFSEHKGRLESEWQRGGNPDTEELRQALQRYRSFFNRLLST
jgi:hypothetical protein